MAAGTPAARRSVPGGVSQRYAGSEDRDAEDRAQRPAPAGLVAPRPATSRPAPAAAARAAPRRRRSPVGARPVARGGLRRGGHVAQRVEGQPAGQGQQGNQPQEHPAPPGQLAHDGRQRRAEDPGHHPRRGEHREHPRLEALRQAAADRDVRRRGQGAAAEALEEAGGDRAPASTGRGRRSPGPGRTARARPRTVAGAASGPGRRPPARCRSGCPGRRPCRPSRRAGGRRAPPPPSA